MSAQPAPPVAGLLLAAGGGRRLGGPKALVRLHGERLVDRGVRLLRDGGCGPVVVVAGATPLDVAGATVVDNPVWRSGMGSSLRTGLVALPAEACAVVVVLVDQPLIGPEAVRRVVAAHRSGATVAVATYGGRRGHPVLFARPVWDEVAASVRDDSGARHFLAAHAALVTPVACDATGIPDDLDTPGDLVDLEDRLSGR